MPSLVTELHPAGPLSKGRAFRGPSPLWALRATPRAGAPNPFRLGGSPDARLRPTRKVANSSQSVLGLFNFPYCHCVDRRRLALREGYFLFGLLVLQSSVGTALPSNLGYVDKLTCISWKSSWIQDQNLYIFLIQEGMTFNLEKSCLSLQRRVDVWQDWTSKAPPWLTKSIIEPSWFSIEVGGWKNSMLSVPPTWQSEWV